MAKIALFQDVMVEYVGYMYISAVLKQAGHTVELFCCDRQNENKIMTELQAYHPDVVGFSVLTPSLNFMLHLGQRVKKETGAITIYGNIHAILNPEIIEMPSVDIVCIGEGEYPMLELCSCLDKNEPYTHIRGLWIRTSQGVIRNDLSAQLVDIENLPFHDRALYDKYSFFRYSRYLRISTGRGCPYHCSFCSNRALARHYGQNRYIRKESPKRAIEEIEYQVHQRKRVDFIFFTDEIFWIKNDWLYEFLDLYKKRVAIPFCATFRFGPIEEKEIKLLAEAKAKHLIFAVESGSERQRKTLLKKYLKDSQIFQIAKWLHKYNIKFTSSVMFGLPGDTVKDHIDRLKFYIRLKPTYLWSSFFQPYPGLELTKSESVQSLISQNKEFKMTFHHSIFLNVPDKERLANLKKVYFLCMLFPKLSRFFIWLTQFKVPLLFDFLFMLHFSYYVFICERVSFLQFLVHIKFFAINPLIEQRIHNSRKAIAEVFRSSAVNKREACI